MAKQGCYAEVCGGGRRGDVRDRAGASDESGIERRIVKKSDAWDGGVDGGAGAWRSDGGTHAAGEQPLVHDPERNEGRVGGRRRGK